MDKMIEIRTLIINWNTSGTNSNHDPEFVSFKRKFKSAMLFELKKINATNVVFNYGHYYISGFFTYGTQPYYFCLSDVRNFSETRIYVRTAKNYNDFTGGANIYLDLETNMFIDSKLFN